MTCATINSEQDRDDENAKKFAEWVKKKAQEIGVTEDYYLLEFI
jgi:hypothetical protein